MAMGKYEISLQVLKNITSPSPLFVTLNNTRKNIYVKKL